MYNEFTAKLKANKNKVKSLFLTVLSLGFIVLSISACDNKKNKSNPVPMVLPPNYYNGSYNGALCPNCGTNVGWTIFAGTDSTNVAGTVKLSLDFYGDPSTGYNFYDPRIPITYTGSVVVRGQLIVSAYDSLLCNIPPGQYQVTSLSAGQWQSGVATGLYLQAFSAQGVTVVMRLAKGVIYNPSGTYSWYPNKLYGTLVFDNLNYQRCYTSTGPASTDLTSY